MAAPDHLAHLRADTVAFAATLDDTTLDLPVPSCPGWDLRTLAGHLGWVHRWAAAAVGTGAEPDVASLDGPPEPARELAAWIVAGGEALADRLASVGPDSPTWHPFPVARVAGVWRRRQAQETSVHRWDAQSTVGVPEPIAADLAADGVGEYFEVMLPRRFAREGTSPPARPEWLHLEATDVVGSWWVRAEGAEVQLGHPGGEAPDATLVGRAEDLQLVLCARRPAGVLSAAGDPTLLAAWLALGGN